MDKIRWGSLLFLLVTASRIHAIVTADSSYNADISYGQIVDGVNFGGVVEITSVIDGTTFGCSGSLLTDGYSILTAGHCVTTASGSATPTSVTVYFQGPNGMVGEAISNIQVDPSYSAGNSQNGSDLAVLTLSQQAPPFAVGYSLFSSGPVEDTPVILAGYGYSGTGTAGADGSLDTLGAGKNEYEGLGSTFFGYSSQLLVGEFYEEGVTSTNALGCDPRYFDSCTETTPYDASDEVDIAPGDSGGPTFYDGEIIGVHDLEICAASTTDSTSCATPPSVNASNNSYFGEVFADTSVDDNLTFIKDAELPEPATFRMFGLGLISFAVGAYRRHRRQGA